MSIASPPITAIQKIDQRKKFATAAGSSEFTFAVNGMHYFCEFFANWPPNGKDIG
jgi:hypothetical protein